MNIRAIAKQDDHEAAYLAAIERDLAYLAALALVNCLEPDPTRNTSRMIGGKRCHTLDEAVRTLLESKQKPII